MTNDERWEVVRLALLELSIAVGTLKQRADAGSTDWRRFDYALRFATQHIEKLDSLTPPAKAAVPPDRYMVVWYGSNESDGDTLTRTLNRMAAQWCPVCITKDGIGCTVVYERRQT